MVTMVAIKHAAMEERLHMGPKEKVSMQEDKCSVRGATLSNNLYSSAGATPCQSHAVVRDDHHFFPPPQLKGWHFLFFTPGRSFPQIVTPQTAVPTGV